MTQTVIIIGAARSGTKFLRSILAADARVRAVPYDINYVWRYGHEGYPDDALPPSLADGETVSYIRSMVSRLAQGRPSNDEIIVEKTVSNSLRVGFVDRVYPDALYIHLLRDGRDVVESSMRQWRRRPGMRYLIGKLRTFPIRNVRYAAWFVGNAVAGLASGRPSHIWGPRYPGIEADLRSADLLRVCARQWQECIERSMRDFASMDAKRFLPVKYEELVTGKNAVTRIADFVGIQDSAALARAYEAVVVRDTTGQWKTRLSGEDGERLQELLQSTLRTAGY